MSSGKPTYVFGPGTVWATPTADAFGNAITNATPVVVAALQDLSLDFGADIKELYGQFAFPIDISGGKQKLGIKLKNAQVFASLWNAIFFGQSLTSGVYAHYLDIAGTAIPSTPFQITPVTAYTSSLPAGATFGYDLGVRDSNNIPFQRVASGPTAGQYSLAGGVYTFATADTGTIVYFSFNYTATSTVAKKMVVQNVLMGQKPTFQLDVLLSSKGQLLTVTFPNCVAPKLGLGTKLDDYAIPELDISAFAQGSGSPFTWSTSN